MVTATFLKPMLKYEDLGETKPLIMQWTYDMMQNMKDIVNDNTQQIMIDEFKSDRDEKIGKEKSELFQKLLNEHQSDGYNLYDLQREYEKEPSLSIICPDLSNEIEKNPDIYNDEHTDLNIQDIFDIKKISEEKQRNGIGNLLYHIETNIYKNGPLIEQGFNVLGRKHTQLWFLPTNLSNKKSGEKLEDGVVEPLMRILSEELLKKTFF